MKIVDKSVFFSKVEAFDIFIKNDSVYTGLCKIDL